MPKKFPYFTHEIFSTGKPVLMQGLPEWKRGASE